MDLDRLDVCDSVVIAMEDKNKLLDSLLLVQAEIISNQDDQIEVLNDRIRIDIEQNDFVKRYYSESLKTEKKKHLKTKLVVVGQTLLIILILL